MQTGFKSESLADSQAIQLETPHTSGTSASSYFPANCASSLPACLPSGEIGRRRRPEAGPADYSMIGICRTAQPVTNVARAGGRRVFDQWPSGPEPSLPPIPLQHSRFPQVTPPLSATRVGSTAAVFTSDFPGGPVTDMNALRSATLPSGLRRRINFGMSRLRKRQNAIQREGVRISSCMESAGY